MTVYGHDVVIANTETTSPAVNVDGRVVVGLRVGTVAATTATFTATHEKVGTPKDAAATPTFRTVRGSDGVAFSTDTADNSHFSFDPAALASVTQIKIVAGAAASGDETWTLLTRNVE